MIDDLIVYRGTNDYFLVVNAAKIEEDFDLDAVAADRGEVALSDLVRPVRSSRGAGTQVGRSTPDSSEFCHPAIKCRRRRVLGIPVFVARTGYTGEDGFELFYPAAAGGSRLESTAGNRRSAWSETVRPGGARHIAYGSLLPVEWSGPFGDAYTARSWSRSFRRSLKTGICRTGRLAACKKKQG